MAHSSSDSHQDDSDHNSSPATDAAATSDPAAGLPSHIVGIGASAGGLESLERLFTNMPCDTGMAFVVIQHLSPDFKSLMDELLARYTDIPVRRAEEELLVEANTIYLIPPKKEMVICDGRLLLTDKDPKQTLTMPIDRFFRSLAQDVGPRSIGIILSGTGSDGSRGIVDIHREGGLTLCESLDTATFDGMPKSAIETGIIDQTLPPERLPSALINYKLRLPFGEAMSPADQPTPEGIDAVFVLLNEKYGIDFSHYKPNTVGRRIQRRLTMLGIPSIQEYAEKVKADSEELNALYKDLLIGVTRFFRDREAFEKLEKEVIPDLVQKAASEEEIRIWVAGCATGEEAYSLAIILHEQLEAAGQPINVKIFATDVHRDSLNFASNGQYGREALGDVNPERLHAYFDRQHESYQVVSGIRQMVVFATHNAICDAPFTRLDLITCRNLLIYFQPLAQRKALTLFHFGLKAGGWLFLGPSESTGHLQDELEVVDNHWKLYRKTRDSRLPTDIELPLSKGPRSSHGLHISSAPSATALPDVGLVGAYDAMLDRFMPPGLLIDEKRQLLHAFGGAERYLRVSPGRPTGDVLEMLDRELRTAVTGAVQRVLRDRTPVTYTGVRVRGGDEEQKLRVTVESLMNPRSRVAQLLILLERLSPSTSASDQQDAGRADDDLRKISEDRIDTLEDELRYSKENLQTTIEELETSNEEMQATNEELVASNEELQSTNEELQSVNEELHTVNAEYQKKIAELSELTSDMDNLLESTEVGTIFLDRELRIRKFTPQIGQDFHLLPQDIGRPIDSFAHNIVHPTLMDDLRKVVEEECKSEHEVHDRQGKWLYLRILPYRTRSKKVDGVVLTLIDISLLKKAEQQLSEGVRRRDQFLAMLSHELRNPLGAILNAVQVLNRLELDCPGAGEPLNIVERQSRHMSRLLDDLLDVSRVTQDKIELRLQPVDARSVLQDAIDVTRPLLTAAGLEVSISCPDEEMMINGDEARLQQALTNLLSNAARYTPAGGKVAVSVTCEDRKVLLSVRDDGVGIPGDELDSVFEMFVQSNHSLDRSDGGMGIGLTLVRSIIEKHGGQVDVQSDGPGHGCEFVISLPRHASWSDNGRDGRRAPTRPAPPAARRESGGQIVIVEDKADVRRMLRMVLELEGYEVEEAADGAEGLAVIERFHPAVALIDIGLPGLNGYEVATRLRQSPDNGETYLVALTGYGQSNDVQAAMEAGFDQHLVKPLDTKQLFQILDAYRKQDHQDDPAS